MTDLTSMLAPRFSNKAVKPSVAHFTRALSASYREECSSVAVVHLDSAWMTFVSY